MEGDGVALSDVAQRGPPLLYQVYQGCCRIRSGDREEEKEELVTEVRVATAIEGQSIRHPCNLPDDDQPP